MLLKSSKTNLQNKLNLLLLSLLAFNFSLSSLANQNTKTEPKKEVKKIIKN